MPKYQYTIKGKPYQEIDLKSHIMALASDLDLTIHLKVMKTRFILEVEGEEEAFKSFEPQLLKTLTELINIHSYVKKEHNTSQKKLSQKNSQGKDEELLSGLKTAIQFLMRGDVIAVKDKNGFHIVANASRAKAIENIRAIIHQPAKPLSLIFKNIIGMQKLILLSKKEKELLLTPEIPFVTAKIKNLHRLERDRYRYTLSPKVNPLNKRISVSLPYSEFYTQLFEEIAFPLVSIDAKTPDGKIIANKETLLQTYGNSFKFILDSDEEIKIPFERDVYQIVYGKPRKTVPETETPTGENSLEVVFDYETAKIGNYHFFPLKILLDENLHEQPKYSALSLLFDKLPLEEVIALNLPFEAAEITTLYNQWTEDIHTKISHSLLTLFDAVASLSGQLHEKSFEDESVLLAEGAFEVCEEELFGYEIKENEIKIDIVSNYLQNNTLKYLASTLTNTLSTIITQLAKEAEQDVTIKGKLFQYRELTELTIEKLEDENINCYY